MGRPVTATIPHSLGKEEARRRISDGFATIERQMGGGLLGAISFENRWEGDRLHFKGGALGQTISGRLDVLADKVQIEIDLPEILAAIAERIKAGLTKETQKLLEKK
jgi:Putative polyhydroxyalkanoic acid system protein (PHA_gran_rgn)